MQLQFYNSSYVPVLVALLIEFHRDIFGLLSQWELICSERVLTTILMGEGKELDIIYLIGVESLNPFSMARNLRYI